MTMSDYTDSWRRDYTDFGNRFQRIRKYKSSFLIGVIYQFNLCNQI
jgi:hypothetical protein